MTGVALIHDLVRSGRCSPADGAFLLELRRRIEWRRRPWWSRLGEVLVRMIFA